jgi:hypothetical protein
MKTALKVLTFVLAALPAWAQVDTLQFREISNFTVPDRVYSTYFQDINNDNLPEMINCQANRIYVYNPLDGDCLWTSPLLGRNSPTWMVIFGDLNEDGFPDLAVMDSTIRDSSFVKVFDANHDSLIWVSPDLHARQRCLAIGDRNSDGVNDIIIFTRGDIHYQHNDTAWVDIYDGPNFSLGAHRDFPILSESYMDPHFYPGVEARRSDNLYKADLIDFSSSGQPQPKIVLFLYLFAVGGTYDGVYSFNYRMNAGNYKIFDPISLTFSNVTGSGTMQSYSLNPNGQGGVSLCSYTKYSRTLYIFDPYGSYSETFYHDTDYYEILSADGNLVSTILKDYDSNHYTETYYSGGIIGDIDLANNGLEICYKRVDSLQVLAFPSGAYLWSTPLNSARDAQYYLFHLHSIFESPQIFWKIWSNPNWMTIDGTTAWLTAVFPYDAISNPTFFDLDIDGDDEMILISRTSPFTIKVERAGNPNGINDGTGALPLSCRLSPNYPNPFNPTTTIQFELPKASLVSLDIYDLLGRKIETLVSGKQEAGTHSVIWDGRDKSSGIYFYKLQAGDFTETKRMLLLK